MSELENESVTEIELKTKILTKEEAIRRQLHYSFANDGLARGLREVVKSIENDTAKLVILAKDCESKEYTQLIKALCKSREKPLMEIDTRLKLGELVGLCKTDEEGNATKIVRCSSCSIIEWGENETKEKILSSILKK